MRVFAWFTGRWLVDYYAVFIVLPLLLTVFLGLGFRRIEELTILDAKVLYTPASAPCWHEEKVLSKVRSCSLVLFILPFSCGRSDQTSSCPNAPSNGIDTCTSSFTGASRTDGAPTPIRTSSTSAI